MKHKEIMLPVLGLDHPSDATSLELLLADVEGILQTQANFADKTVAIRFDPNLLETWDLAYLMQEAGFDVPEVSVRIALKGLTCISCVARVEGALGELPGVLETNVNLRESNAEIKLIPSVTGESELAGKLKEAGYELLAIEPIRQLESARR